MKPHVIPGMDFADYAKAPGINASALRLLHQKSLAHVRAMLDGKLDTESDEKDFGKTFHALALENREEYVVRPATYTHPKDGEKPWNGNAGTCREWLAAHEGQHVISAADGVALCAMREAVAPYLPADSRNEISVFAERDGLPVKCRIDCLPAGEDQPVIDLKTCRNAHPEAFMRDAFRMGYHIQAAWTLSLLRLVGIKREVFRFVAVETEAPFATCVIDFHDTDPSALRMGRRRANALFARIAEAQRTGRWDAYGVNEAENFIPKWMIPELEQTA